MDIRCSPNILRNCFGVLLYLYKNQVQMWYLKGKEGKIRQISRSRSPESVLWNSFSSQHFHFAKFWTPWRLRRGMKLWYSTTTTIATKESKALQIPDFVKAVWRKVTKSLDLISNSMIWSPFLISCNWKRTYAWDFIPYVWSMQFVKISSNKRATIAINYYCSHQIWTIIIYCKQLIHNKFPSHKGYHPL
jgi:hypothetical protein